MGMTVTLDLPDKVAALLDDEARAEGSPLEDVALSVLISHFAEKRPGDLIAAVAPIVIERDAELIAQLRARA